MHLDVSFVGSRRAISGSRPANATWRRALRQVSAALFSAAAILAMSSALPEVAEASPYTAAHKFRRGVSNMTLGVLAIPGQMTVQSRDKGYAIGLPLGFAQGVGWMVVTEAVGVWEFLTCPFEFPPQFRPLITPEYPWDYFKRRGKGAGFAKRRRGATRR